METSIPNLRKAFEIALKEKKYKSRKIQNAGDSVFYILHFEIKKDHNLYDIFDLVMQKGNGESYFFSIVPPKNSVSSIESQKVKEDLDYLVKLFKNDDYINQTQILLNAFGNGILD